MLQAAVMKKVAKHAGLTALLCFYYYYFFAVVVVVVVLLVAFLLCQYFAFRLLLIT